MPLIFYNWLQLVMSLPSWHAIGPRHSNCSRLFNGNSWRPSQPRVSSRSACLQLGSLGSLLKPKKIASRYIPRMASQTGSRHHQWRRGMSQNSWTLRPAPSLLSGRFQSSLWSAGSCSGAARALSGFSLPQGGHGEVLGLRAEVHPQANELRALGHAQAVPVSSGHGTALLDLARKHRLYKVTPRSCST